MVGPFVVVNVQLALDSSPARAGEVWAVYGVPFGLLSGVGHSHVSRAADAQGILFSYPYI